MNNNTPRKSTALRHSPADIAAAFKRAAESALSDMEAAAAKDTAARTARLEALEAPRRAAYAELHRAVNRAEAAEAAALAAWLPLRNARHAASGVNSPHCPAEAAALATLRAAQESAVAARRRLA